MRILGISAYYHDAAAALLRDGEIVAAAQEERFSRSGEALGADDLEKGEGNAGEVAMEAILALKLVCTKTGLTMIV